MKAKRRGVVDLPRPNAGDSASQIGALGPRIREGRGGTQHNQQADGDSSRRKEGDRSSRQDAERRHKIDIRYGLWSSRPDGGQERSDEDPGEQAAASVSVPGRRFVLASEQPNCQMTRTNESQRRQYRGELDDFKK